MNIKYHTIADMAREAKFSSRGYVETHGTEISVCVSYNDENDSFQYEVNGEIVDHDTAKAYLPETHWRPV